MRFFIGGERCWLASAKIFHDLTDCRGRQVRKPKMAKVRVNIQVQVLSIGDGSSALYIGCKRLEPKLASLANRGRLAWCDMDALADVDSDFGLRASASFLRSNVSICREPLTA